MNFQCVCVWTGKGTWFGTSDIQSVTFSGRSKSDNTAKVDACDWEKAAICSLVAVQAIEPSQ